MRAIVASILLAMSPATKAEPVDYPTLIRAIGEIEQGAWGKPGGTCNIMYAAWSDASPLSYVASGNESQAMPVYFKHLDKLSSQLRAAGVWVNPQTLGTCWRWGFDGARRRHWKSDQGERTANLYADYRKASVRGDK